MHRLLVLSAAVVLAGQSLAPSTLQAQQEVAGKIGTELRFFPQRPLYPAQPQGLGTSMHIEPELYLDFGGGDTDLLVAPFLRVDRHDEQRSHADIREAFIRHALSRSLELRVGLARIFWGVAESKHLVDIINQRDLVESPDGESVLGQPLAQLTWVSASGVIVDLFAMSGFRERTFPGAAGRLRGPLPVDDDATYASRAKRLQPEGALRVAWSQGPLDVGLHYFFGTRRDPELRLAHSSQSSRLRPHYRLMHRVGVDGTLALGDTLLKLEAIARTTPRGREPQGALTAGLEHTLATVVANADLGLLLEYSHDGRDPSAALILEDDLFAGIRVALNDVDDTQLVAGAAIHRDLSGSLLVVEASRRLSEALSLQLEARVVLNAEPERFEYALRRDGYARATLLTHF